MSDAYLDSVTSTPIDGIPTFSHKKPRRCRCCGALATGWMCTACRSEHGNKMPAHAPDTYAVLCKTYERERERFRAELEAPRRPTYKVTREQIERAARWSV